MKHKPLPIGVEDFKRLVDNEYYFVDKTLMIKELLENKETVNLAYLGREYKAVCKRAQISDVRGLHDLRHTYATKLIRQGVDIKTVSEQLGHSTVSFTLRTYVHTVDSEKAKKMDALSW